MIGKLKIKFVFLSMLSLFALLVVIVTGMNILNFHFVAMEADDILSLLSHNHGAFPDFENGRENEFPRNMSPEIPYESRFFFVLLDDAWEVMHAETQQIRSVTTDTAIEYANEAMQKNSAEGFIGSFRYVRVTEDETTRIIFLDCGRKLIAARNFLFISIIMAAVGYIVVFLVISFYSGKIIRPIAESYDKQKRFITDAGHEIKTPLTIINANVDLLEMEIGENECLSDIQQQAKRLTALTNNLVYLARMEEAERTLQMIDFPVSEIVQETAMSFKALAQTKDVDFTCNVQPMLSMRGNDGSITQLVSILMDNALKYSPNSGSVSLQLNKQGRSLHLTVVNTIDADISAENLRHVFDRFYRTDQSRNSETGGHGIGLSMAQAIVAAHGGKISAHTHNGNTFQIKAVFPA